MRSEAQQLREPLEAVRPPLLVTVTLTEHDGRTEMMFHQGLFASVEARDGHEQGWASCFERLAELLRFAPHQTAA